MLYLKFTVAGERYVMATNAIIEVAPLIPLRKLPDVPPHVAGLMNYRGRSLPVIDVSQLLAGHDAALRLSTRIVIVPAGRDGDAQHEVGVLLEKATETLEIPDDEFIEPGLENPKTTYLEKVVLDAEGMLQRVSPKNILSKMDVDLIFSRDKDRLAVEVMD